MKEMSSQEQEWIDAYLNGTIDPEDFNALQDSMMASPALRSVMRRYLSLDYHLQNDAGELDSATAPWLEREEEQYRTKTTDRMFWRPSFWAAAAVVMVLGATLVFSLRDSKADIATITAIHGPVQLTSSDGQVRGDLEVGTVLNGGLLESLLPASWVEFVFKDGSKVTVSGQSTLMLSSSDRKELHLRQGSLSAKVVAQSESTPMVVHTQTAKLDVLGTQFHVDAESTSTKLIVNEGLVRMKRLADGSDADVSAGSQATAAADDNRELEVVPRGKAKQMWRGNLAEEAIYGKWSSGLEALATKLKKAVASGKMSEDAAMAKYKATANFAVSDGLLKTRSKIAEHGKGSEHIVMVSLSKGNDSPIIVAAGARFRIRGTIQADAPVTFGFTTQHPSGGYAGKYVSTQTLKASGDEFDLELPVADFQAVHRGGEHSALGMEISDWWCSTSQHEADLEITHVELLVP